MASGLCGVAMPLFGCNSNGFQATKISSDISKKQTEVAGMKIENSLGWAGNFMLMMELRKKILTFRDIIDLPPCDDSCPINELVKGTVNDLHKLYPDVVPSTLISEMKATSIYQCLAHFYDALNSIEDSWAKNHRWIANFRSDKDVSLEYVSSEQLGGVVLEKLEYTSKLAGKMFDVMDEDEKHSERTLQVTNFSPSRAGSPTATTYPSPVTPTSAPPELAALSYAPPLLLPLRLQALGKLMLINTKCLSICTLPQGLSPIKVDNNVAEGQKDSKNADNSPNNLTPPPPPPALPAPCVLPQNVVVAPQVPLPMGLSKGVAPPPPPPLGTTKALRPKKGNTKLKRSTTMGNMYRVLKGKVEGSSLDGKPSKGRKSRIGESAGGKQGMADALAEMTKRSAYFQQIEEDVQKHTKSIMELKAAITSFETKDMTKLLKFHNYIEQHLEELTDETQVLARFEGFPTKKLESLRTASAIYSKMEGIVATLESWKIEPPLNKLLDKIECYFNKIKGEVDALERTKDEEMKRFQSHNIHFDFHILVRIKESMVDVSSSCMELALKERREVKAADNAESRSKTEGQKKACIKMLWRGFQFAFRVYSFAGGQDDRAERLTRELAHAIETGPEHD